MQHIVVWHSSCYCCFCPTKQRGPTWLPASHFSSFITGAQNIDARQILLHSVDTRQENGKNKILTHKEYPQITWE